MASGDDEVKCKRSLGMRHSKETKRFKFSLRAVPTQSLASTESSGKSFLKKWDLVRKCNSKEKDVEKATGPGESGSPESETRSAADQIDDKAPPNQFTGTEKSEKEHEGDAVQNCIDFPSQTENQEGCLPPTSTSEPHAGFEDSEYHDSLKVRVAELRRETCVLSCELQKHAAMCMELSDANRLLMFELKKMCEPCVIQILEAKNPDHNPQTDREMELSEIVS